MKLQIKQLCGDNEILRTITETFHTFLLKHREMDTLHSPADISVETDR